MSFNPCTLLDAAKNYGASQSPRLGYSAVVCLALKEFLTARGALESTSTGLVSADEAAAIKQARALGFNPAEMLRDAISARLGIDTPSLTPAKS